MVVKTAKKFRSDRERRAVMAKLNQSNGRAVIVMGLPGNPERYRYSFAVPTQSGLYVNRHRRNVEEFADRHDIDRSEIVLLRQDPKRRAKRGRSEPDG